MVPLREHSLETGNTEQARLRNEELYDLAVRGMSVGLWDWDIVNNNIYWTEKFRNFLGIADPDYKPSFDDFAGRLHPDDKDATLKMLDDHLRRLSPFNIEYRLKRDDGTYVWLHASGQAAWDAGDKPIRMVGSVADIGRHKAAELQVTEDAARMTVVMDTVLDGLLTIDAHGTVQSFNQSAVRIFGYRPEEVVGQNVKMLMPDPYHSEHDGYLKNYLTTGEKKVIGIGREVSARRKDGSIFPMELGINEASIQGKRMFVGTIRDITERKNAEIQRQQLMERLMQSNTELEHFAYVASHDMQEPVRMVINFSKIVTKDYGDRLDDAGKECLQFIAESADRIHDMIEDLLDYARMENEENSMTLVDGASELRHVLSNLCALIEETGAHVTYDKLPAFQGNPVQFMRLMQNLIINAIKYQPPGNVPAVHISIEDEGNSWRLSVKDNGMGIDEAFLQNIFEPFRRLHSWGKIRGSGLGLAVCKKIVENHGGKIWVKSIPGKGSTFFVALPKQCIDKQAAA